MKEKGLRFICIAKGIHEEANHERGTALLRGGRVLGEKNISKADRWRSVLRFRTKRGARGKG